MTAPRSICIAPPIHVQVTVKHDPIRHLWTAEESTLGVNAFGGTEQEALDGLEKAVALRLDHLDDDTRANMIGHLLGLGPYISHSCY